MPTYCPPTTLILDKSKFYFCPGLPAAYFRRKGVQVAAARWWSGEPLMLLSRGTRLFKRDANLLLSDLPSRIETLVYGRLPLLIHPGHRHLYAKASLGRRKADAKMSAV